MSEMVMVAPVILLVMVMLFYFGGLMPRTQRASMMVRYETWRDTEVGAPGPGSGLEGEHDELNEAFFGGRAEGIVLSLDDRGYPEDAANAFLDSADAMGSGAGRLADAWLRLPGGSRRLGAGRREVFEVMHGGDAALWDQLMSGGTGGGGGDNPERRPLVRRHVRIGGDWSYTEDWRAAAPDWPSVGGGHPHHMRALRDAFLDDFDRGLDQIDGQTTPEYAAERGGAEVWTNESLAGLIRGLYLKGYGYVGPELRLQ